MAMESGEKIVSRYDFGPWSLEAETMVLSRGAERIQLTRKRYEILCMLLENAGRLVTKKHLLDQIWPEQDVAEANLANNIYWLRRVVETNPHRPKVIITVTGLGYKLQGEVIITLGEVASGDGAKEQNLTSVAESPDLPAASAPEFEPVTTDGTGLKPVSGIKRRRAVLLLAAGLVAIGMVIGGWLWRRNRLSGSSVEVPYAVPLTSYPGAERYPALSSDGGLIAFSWDGESGENEDIYVRQTVEGELVRVTSHPSADSRPVWSPDGHYLAFLRASEPPGQPQHLIIVPALGGGERQLARVSGGLDWSPDGQQLAVTGLAGEDGGVGIHLISVDGKVRRRLLPPEPNDNSYDSDPQFSPDGRRLAFLRWKSDAASDILITENLPDGATAARIRRLTSDDKLIIQGSLRWSADGERVLFISNRSGSLQLWQIDIDGGAPELVPGFSESITSYTISRDGGLFAFTNEQADPVIKVSEPGRDAGNGTAGLPCQINSTRYDDTPRFSPDGSMIVFTSNRTGWDELWVARADCTQVRQLTRFRELGVGSPRWSPDGQKIVFDRREKSESDIYTIGLDGSALLKVTDSVGSNTMPAWSPDGKWIYFTSNRGRSVMVNNIWKVPAMGGEVVQVTREAGMEPSFTSDASILYFNKIDHIWKKDLTTGEESEVSELSDYRILRLWEVGADSIFCVTRANSRSAIVERLDLKTRRLSFFTRIEGAVPMDRSSFSVSRDLSRVAVSSSRARMSDIMLIRGWRGR